MLFSNAIYAITFILNIARAKLYSSITPIPKAIRQYHILRIGDFKRIIYYISAKKREVTKAGLNILLLARPDREQLELLKYRMLL